MLVTLAREEVIEQTAQITIIGRVLKAQASAVLQVRDEFARGLLAQLLDRSGHLFVHDLIDEIFFIVCLET